MSISGPGCVETRFRRHGAKYRFKFRHQAILFWRCHAVAYSEVARFGYGETFSYSLGR